MNEKFVAKATRLIVALLVAAACLPVLTKSDEPVRAEKPAADSMLGDEVGQVRDDNGLKMKMVWCPPGSFGMGAQPSYFIKSKSYEAVVEAVLPVDVFLTRGYWLGKYEVTQAEWKSVMRTEPWKVSGFQDGHADLPALHIDWHNAMAFCRKLTAEEHIAGRLIHSWEYTLPTEARWERACRARSETRFSFGDDESKLGEYGWHSKKPIGFIGGVDSPGRVGQKKPNPWGLYDMHGNAAEWCLDHYADELPGGRDPVAADDNDKKYRVLRGGAFNNSAADCSSASRFRSPTNVQFSNLGFRVALSPVQPAK